MPDHFEERVIGGVRIRIDRTLCVAFETCIDSVPEVFRLADDGIVTFVDGAVDVMRGRLVEACQACPVDALSLIDN